MNRSSLVILLLATLHLPVAAQETVGPVAGDRVYTADQSSNTVSVIDPLALELLGVIRLGDPVPGALSPLYRGELLVHGLGFSPDGKTLAVVSVGSNSVTLIDTQTNRIKGRIYTGRAPHEAFFTPDGRELWVSVRGEDYLAVIDPHTLREVRRVPVVSGPGMVLFSPDGRYAFVPSSFTPELAVVDTRSYRVVARVAQASKFSPNLAVSADGSEVWITLKDSGKTQVISGHPPFRTLATLASGPITNHVALVDTPEGNFAYVTVGGLNEVKVYRRTDGRPRLVARIPTGALPHGAWSSPDGQRVYIGLEGEDKVQVIDTTSQRVVGSVPVGQLPQAVVYVPDAVKSGQGHQNLEPLSATQETLALELRPTVAGGPERGTVSVNTLGLIDLVQVAASGLTPNETYTLALSRSATSPYGRLEPIARLEVNAGGTAIAQTLGPIRQVARPSAAALPRYFVVTPMGSSAPVLVQEIAP